MRNKKEFLLVSLLFVTISIIYSFPVLQNIENWGIDEWNIYIVNIATQVDTILEYHQIPLWTPYKSGGSFMLAHPMSMFLSPFFIIPLLLGPVVGMKISFLFHLIVGLFSMYLLARYLKLGVLSSCFASFIFCLNTRYTLFINRGDFEFMPQVFFPLVFLFYLKFINERSNNLKYLFWGAVSCSLIFLDGGVGYYVFIFVLDSGHRPAQAFLAALHGNQLDLGAEQVEARRNKVEKVQLRGLNCPGCRQITDQ